MSVYTDWHLERLAKQLRTLFRDAADDWARGNNSGDPRLLERYTDSCDRLRKQAEGLLAHHQIDVDYPGLNPTFTVVSTGREYRDVLEALRARHFPVEVSK